MSIASEIDRIMTAKNRLRSWLMSIGAVSSTATLEECINAASDIVNNGAVSSAIEVGTTYTIARGYHNGGGTVSAVAGHGQYLLQSKNATPTKQRQAVAPDDGYYGLSEVVVQAIPESYADVSVATLTEPDVLTGKVFVGPLGQTRTGTMPNQGAIEKTIDGLETTSFTIPAGYHNGSGTVSLTDAIELALKEI